ncbi:hypothetical protein IFM89_015789 [Coptis chinensis]|uniref:UDP-glycosyltransferase n=1 Tax=Coptis chinensis TaxID=261450 RepID=A0A835IQR6_9MAGN|nr:hypothetical protein IFM89_015789 [Coptis chinensis]
MNSSLVAKKPHAVCIPAPFQSHIIAMLKLAKLLHLKGFHITFVNTKYNHQRILKSRGADSLNGLPDFKFETTPVGLPESDINASQDMLALLKSMASNFLGPFRNVITKLNEASAFSDNTPVTCIVSDVFMSFPVEAAEEFGIPIALLCTVSACVLMIYLHSQHLQRGLLPLKGFHITFVNTEYNHQRILKSRGADSLNGLPDFKLKPSRMAYQRHRHRLPLKTYYPFLSPWPKLPRSISNVITKLNEASTFSDNPPLLALYRMLSWAFPIEVFEEFGIPTALLCAGVKDIRLKNLPSFFLEGGDALYNYVQAPIERATNASAIIINTFDALESSVLEAMRTLPPPIYTIGPLQLLIEQLPQNTQLRSIESNIWIENQHCLQWLDIQELNSVVYVSFGSHTVMTPEQLIEIAWGLANSKHPFLWVIKSDLVIGEAAILPPEFTQEIADRIRLVSARTSPESLFHWWVLNT